MGLTKNFKTIPELIAACDQVVRNGGLAFVKWTCPACGERIIADQPNQFCAMGYRHSTKANGEQCGCVYRGTEFGIFVILPTSAAGRAQLEKIWDLSPPKGNVQIDKPEGDA